MSAITKEQRNKIHREVDTNYDFFVEYLKSHKEIQKKHKGEYALIRHQEIVRFFKDRNQAIQWGREQYPNRMFSVQDVDNKSDVVGYGVVA